MYVGIAEWKIVGKQGRDDSIKQFSIYNTLHFFFIVHVFMKENVCRGVVYRTIIPNLFPYFCCSPIPTSHYDFYCLYRHKWRNVYR